MQTQASTGSEVVYGVHAVRELVERRPSEIRSLFVAEGDEAKGDAIGKVVAAAAKAGLSTIGKSRRELDRLTHGGVHQGVVALCAEFEYETDPMVPVTRALEQVTVLEQRGWSTASRYLDDTS